MKSSRSKLDAAAFVQTPLRVAVACGVATAHRMGDGASRSDPMRPAYAGPHPRDD